MIWAFNKELPRAELLKIAFWYTSIWGIFRLANALQIHLGRLVICVRMPWKLKVAQRLHPEIMSKIK